MPVIFESKKAKAIPSFRSNISEPKFFSSFIKDPSGRFDSQGREEKIILLVRAHPVTQAPWIFIGAVFFFLPPVLGVILMGIFTFPQIIFIALFWYSFLFTYIFANFLNYIFNIGIVTDTRLIDIDYQGLLYKEINSVPLTKIEDVTVKSTGFVNSLFQFGDVYVQTAGQHQDIEFKSVPAPSKVATTINEFMSKRDGY